MDEGIAQRFYKLYGAIVPENVMPMRIIWLGNSSVATIANLFRLLRTNHMSRHEITPGYTILLASVGTGINTDTVCCKTYKIFIINGTN
ncbi:hypothetical protein [Niabella hibiscisoli]|uniref:hypothetical protein n=1 Tax=Niabella hibiscisoli TaxID=1825928 RepID=UPI001F0D343B|nr:hypothetical protein [Niabella hibiscisoli]MCH5719408.1 hypothetical protein [Niabella hibiscisoli]